MHGFAIFKYILLIIKSLFLFNFVLKLCQNELKTTNADREKFKEHKLSTLIDEVSRQTKQSTIIDFGNHV